MEDTARIFVQNVQNINRKILRNNSVALVP